MPQNVPNNTIENASRVRKEDEHTSRYDVEHDGPLNGPRTNPTSGHGDEAGENDDDAQSDDPHNQDDHEPDGSEYDDDDDGSEDGDGEEEEPALKYERMGGAAQEFFETGKDSASALCVGNDSFAIGTHNGLVHVISFTGARIKTYRPHTASVIDMCMDETGDIVGTAGVDGQVLVHTLSTSESIGHNFKRPMRTIALEPGYATKVSKAYVCGGMAGEVVLQSQGWLGNFGMGLVGGRSNLVINRGEENDGPIWLARWRGDRIAWANDTGIKLYDCASQMRFAHIDRPPESPRADLFKCTLCWQDDVTLLVGWADAITIVRIRPRPGSIPTSMGTLGGGHGNLPLLIAEVQAVLKVDCMIAGVVPHPLPVSEQEKGQEGKTITASSSSRNSFASKTHTLTPMSCFLILSYIPPDSTFEDDAIVDRDQQKRKAANPPELMLISRSGSELGGDMLPMRGHEVFGCNDYVLAEVDRPLTVPEHVQTPQVGGLGTDGGVGAAEGRFYLVLSPRGIVIVRARDRRDHVDWLVEKYRYDEALKEIEAMERDGWTGLDRDGVGRKYLDWLFDCEEWEVAAKACPTILGNNAKAWEEWIFLFAQKLQLQAIAPYVPIISPQLSKLCYGMILAYYLAHDREALLRTIKEWPSHIYDVQSLIVAILPEPQTKVLMECLAELYIANRQPGQALQYFLRLRRPNVFQLIQDNNLYTDVQGQVLLLVEFDQELIEIKRKAGEKEGKPGENIVDRGQAINLLVNYTQSIPMSRVVQQLGSRPYYLYLYLDALFERDRHLGYQYADRQLELYAEYAPKRLTDFLRASSYYQPEKAYQICKGRDLVPEMVYLLGKMGDNKRAMNLIIERLGDVHRAIDFAKEQHDDDLWEDLLRYSETRPAFIKGLLENVSTEINPIRLIRRIQNGLEIPGLKEALIKILQDFNLQIGMLEGCQQVLGTDCTEFAERLMHGQEKGFLISGATPCPVCGQALYQGTQSIALLFLCRHVVHSHCASGGDGLPRQFDNSFVGLSGFGVNDGRSISAKIAFAAMVRARIDQGCPVCHRAQQGEGSGVPATLSRLQSHHTHPRVRPPVISQ